MNYKPQITTFPHFFTLPPTIDEEGERWEVKGIIQGDEQKNEPKHYELYNLDTHDTIYLTCRNIDEMISEIHAGAHKAAKGGSKNRRRTKKSKRRQTKKSKRRQTKKSKRRQTKKSKRSKR